MSLRKIVWGTLGVVIGLPLAIAAVLPEPPDTRTPEEIAAQAKAQEEENKRQAEENRIRHISATRIYSCREHIKAQMHNPKSYEEVDAFYSEKLDAVRIVFRGTNGFGGVVKSEQTCSFGKK